MQYNYKKVSVKKAQNTCHYTSINAVYKCWFQAVKLSFKKYGTYRQGGGVGVTWSRSLSCEGDSGP